MSLDQELRSVLQRAADGCEAPVPDVDGVMAGGRLVRHRQRVRRVVAGAAVAAIVAVGTGGLLWSGLADHPRTAQPAGTNQSPSSWWSPVSPTPGATDSESLPFFLDLPSGTRTPVPAGLAPDGVDLGVYPDYDVSPDGSRVAFNTSHRFSGSAADKLFVANLDGSDLRQIQLPEGLSGYRPDWSPDGTRLVYQLRDASYGDVGNLVIQDVVTGQRTEITDLDLSQDWWFLHPSFSPDGQSVIFHLFSEAKPESGWDVWSVPVTGGPPTLVLRNSALPVYLPNGMDIAFVSPGVGGRSIQIADAQGHRRTLVNANEGIRWLTVSPDGTRIAYEGGGSIYLVAVATGESSRVAVGESAEWVDNDTLLVVPAPPSAP